MSKIIIQISGDSGSGKTITRKAIAEFLKIQFGCRVEEINQDGIDIDIMEVTIRNDGTYESIVDWTKAVTPKLNQSLIR